MQTPIEETEVIIRQLEEVLASLHDNLSEEARSTLAAVEKHEQNLNQSGEEFTAGLDFYERMLSHEDGPRIREYRTLEDTLLRARWLLEMLSMEE
jgi:hypothetical protein